jgi:hypothetical protein
MYASTIVLAVPVIIGRFFIVRCCALSDGGQSIDAVAAPPSSAMKSRRFIHPPAVNSAAVA